jgi:hypothetical protein
MSRFSWTNRATHSSPLLSWRSSRASRANVAASTTSGTPALQVRAELEELEGDGSLCALALGESSATIAEGLANYSGVLTAIALSVTFLRSSVASWVYAAIGAAITAVVTLLMTDATDAPHYTWPYILTTWVLLVVATFIPALRRP